MSYYWTSARKERVAYALLAMFAAEFRRSIAAKTAEAMQRKARAGHVTGGRMFGYDNLCSVCQRVIPPGSMRCCPRGHTDRIINAAEAEVVRTIFTMVASGAGLVRVAKTLNATGALSPRAQQGRPSGWAPSSLHAVIHRTIYRGTVTYNQTKKRDLSGDVAPSDRPQEEWLHIDRPDLRVVNDDLWDTVHTRMRGARQRLVQAGNRWVGGATTRTRSIC
jgi:hypothetical protein